MLHNLCNSDLSPPESSSHISSTPTERRMSRLTHRRHSGSILPAWLYLKFNIKFWSRFVNIFQPKRLTVKGRGPSSIIDYVDLDWFYSPWISVTWIAEIWKAENETWKIPIKSQIWTWWYWWREDFARGEIFIWQ